jgi:secreted Zn-dependent insulinase-like peptidase
LGEESTKHWAAISNKSYLFKKYQLVAAEVEKIELTTVLRFFDKFVAKNAPNRRKLSIQVYSKKHVEKMDEPVPKEGVTLIRATDVIEFKRNMPLFSLPPKVNVENMKLEK